MMTSTRILSLLALCLTINFSVSLSYSQEDSETYLIDTLTTTTLVLGGATSNQSDSSLVSQEVQAEEVIAEEVIAEEVIAIVGNSPIMLSSLEDIKSRVISYRKINGVNSTQTPEEEAFEQLLLERLLSQQARLDSLDKDLDRSMLVSIVEQELEAQISKSGSVRQLEREQGKAIFQIKKDIEKELLDTELSRMLQNSLGENSKVSHNDVLEFFANLPSDSLPMMPPQYSYSQIVKMPEATEDRKYNIREQLLGFRERIIKGERFAVLAHLYSHDYASKIRGGLMEQIDINSLVAPFADALRFLKPGQISEIVETENGLHIIEMISMKGDIVSCRHILLKPEFTVAETEQVTKELDSLSQIITKGETSFSSIAMRHSNDLETAQNGGRVLNLRQYYATGDISLLNSSFALDELNPVDYKVLSKLELGGVSEPYESFDNKGNRIYKIVTLDAKIPAHEISLEYDYDFLYNIAKGNNKNKFVDKKINDLIGSMYIYISPKYMALTLKRSEWKLTVNKYAEQGVSHKIPLLKEKDIFN